MQLSELMSSNVKKKSLCVAASVVAAGMFGARRSADAALVLTLSEPGYAVSVPYTDSATPGTVSFVGSYGSFSTNIVIGYTNLGTPGSTAQLQIESLNVTNNSLAGPDALTVSLSETSPYTFPGTATSTELMTSTLGGTLTPASVGDSVTFQSTATPASGPAVFAPLQSFYETANLNSNGFSVPNTSQTFTRTASYTLANTTVISVAAGETANISGTTTISAVPEPVMAGMLLTGVALLGRTRRSRREA